MATGSDGFDWVGLFIAVLPFAVLIAFLLFGLFGPGEWLVNFPLN